MTVARIEDVSEFVLDGTHSSPIRTETGVPVLSAQNVKDGTPNAVTSAVHDRMPVILDPDAYDLWLDPGMRDVAAASELLKPCDARTMRRYPVSTRINHVGNDDEECSVPVELAQIQNRLFS